MPMQSASDMLGTYAAYHQDARNRLTHYFGIPLIVFSILMLLSLLQIPVGSFNLDAADLLVIVICAWYLRMDLRLGLVTLAFIVPMLIVAGHLADSLTSTQLSVWIGVTFIGGWALQLLGHYYEGRKPALADNLLQIFSGPLFVIAELLFALGLRKQLSSDIQQTAARVDIVLREAGR